MTKIRYALCALLLVQSVAGAQERDARLRIDSSNTATRPGWFSRRDLLHVGGAAAGVGLISLLDEGAAKAIQRPSLHRSSFVRNSANAVQIAGDPGALAISVSLYVVGVASHRPGLADASLHATESIAVSGAITQLLKLSVGRERPNLSADQNAFAFHPAKGYKADFNSFPSGHTTAAFAAATAFSDELRRTHPQAARIASPALYSIATLVGVARMYNNRHWLSDVAAGALIGHFVAHRIESHAHYAAH
ncbi:MAG: phosphatase PAP2 family protein [Gemmatimonadaceae bacterium]